MLDTLTIAHETRRVVILLVCSDQERLTQRRDALKAAGLRVVSASSVADAWKRVDGFDVWAVVIDHELIDDPDARRFGDHYVRVDLMEDTAPEALAMELVGFMSKASDRVQ